ncbi:hypothetical protein KM043_000646 [Ampulex compressa]|nr:hypothetical protein KM043_000646 [Ampulex compressa]
MDSADRLADAGLFSFLNIYATVDRPIGRILSAKTARLYRPIMEISYPTMERKDGVLYIKRRDERKELLNPPRETAYRENSVSDIGKPLVPQNPTLVGQPTSTNSRAWIREVERPQFSAANIPDVNIFPH